MKQLLQYLDTGESILQEVPVPAVTGPNLLVKTRNTVVSAGTERTLVEFGKANLLEKARQQPEKVRQVLDKVRTEGVGTTLEAVRAKLNAPVALGYCHAGIIAETGGESGGFAVGDRVVTNGPHAEYVRVPHTLAAKIPKGVSSETAAFAPVAAIGLQGIRLAEPSLGETVVVVGLGLIGLLTVQLLRANGCQVIGIDRNNRRLSIAERLGAKALEASGNTPAHVRAMTGGVGADAVLLTLSADSDEPVHQAADMCRKRGRLVLVGVTGLNLRREDFYEKELSFQVSCSYGPGRYDPVYEDQARDYPLPYVRWTEQRNFEAVLGLMSSGQLDPETLVTHRVEFDNAPSAYELLTAGEPSLGIVLSYDSDSPLGVNNSERTVAHVETGAQPTSGTVGVIGAGNFATRTLLPALQNTDAKLRTIASGGGTSGAVAAKKFGFARTTTDLEVIFQDEKIDTVFILTQHNSHARLVQRALEAGKHVFVEKPLALTEVELNTIRDVAVHSGRMLLVGFNRRFASLTQKAAHYLKERVGPLSVIVTVNAGDIPRSHWTQDPKIGGGRIVGEACHWLDLTRALVGEPIADVDVVVAHDRHGRPIDDIANLAVQFEDGSTAAIHYLSNGSKSFPKERIECFFDGKTVAVDNWRRLQRYGVAGPWYERPRKIDKGHSREVAVWLETVREGGPSPIPLDELIEVSRWAIRAGEMARGNS